MAYEVVVIEATKTVATMSAAGTLVEKIQAAFGAETSIQVYRVKKTFDNNQADANEVGVIRSLVAEYPVT